VLITEKHLYVKIKQ